MPKIEIPKSALEFECISDTVLRAALRAGLGFPYECNSGSCGTCRFELLEGEMKHARADSPCLTERDKARNRWLGCQAVPQGNCRIKVRLDPHYQSHHRPRRTTAELVSTVHVTHDIIEYAFRLRLPQLSLPGQYALVTLPGMTSPRAYSMCDVSRDGTVWRFQIKRVPGGEASDRLATLHTGSHVEIDGPYGMAYLREDSPRDILCLAGGSGLSPMLSITRAALDRMPGRAVHFVYGGRTQSDLCSPELLADMQFDEAMLKYHPVLSAEPKDGTDWTGHCGFVHEAADFLFGNQLRDLEIYFAGPPPMTEAIKRLLYERNVPQGQVHFDEFF